MFRHMPVPRDTSVSCQIIIVCCESVGNCQTVSKDGPSQLVNKIIFWENSSAAVALMDLRKY